jgi:hypothetical protein
MFSNAPVDELKNQHKFWNKMKKYKKELHLINWSIKMQERVPANFTRLIGLKNAGRTGKMKECTPVHSTSVMCFLI